MPPSPAPNTCWLYLIRHAATANNRAKPPRLQGRRTNPGLSEEGHRQAEQTARFLSSAGLKAVFSSPLLRARQTAEAIATPHGLDVITVDDLIEVDVGIWEGRDWACPNPEIVLRLVSNEESPLEAMTLRVRLRQ